MMSPLRMRAHKTTVKMEYDDRVITIDESDHKLTIHRILTNTPQKELHQIDLQENRELCIEIQRERRSHLANKYGPEGLW